MVFVGMLAVRLAGPASQCQHRDPYHQEEHGGPGSYHRPAGGSPTCLALSRTEHGEWSRSYSGATGTTADNPAATGLGRQFARGIRRKP